MGLFWDDPVLSKKPEVKKEPPKAIWLLDDYLPYLQEAKFLHGVKLMSQDALWRRNTVLTFDIEIYSNYFQVGFADTDSGEVFYEESDIHSDDDNCPGVNWNRLKWVMENRVTTGFNSNGFDLTVLMVGFETKSIKAMKAAANMLIEEEMHPKEVLLHFGIDPMNPPFTADHIDVQEVAPLSGSLKIYAGRIHIKNMMDLPFAPGRWLSPNHKLIIRYYNLARDMPSTVALFNLLKPQLELRMEMSKKYGIDLRSKSDAQIAEYVMKHEIKKIKGKAPTRPKIAPGTIYKYKAPEFLDFKYGPFVNALNVIKGADFEIADSGGFIMPPEISRLNLELNGLGLTMGLGGLHSTESNAKHVSDDEYELWDFDVSSYYPSIILNLRLFPPHIGEAFLYVYKTLVTQRLKAKADGLKMVANSLKIVINGLFGKLGSMWSAVYAPLLMIMVTITGQLSLMMLMDMLHQRGIRVVSANTDGIVIKPRKDQTDEMRQVVAEWEKLTNFEMEGNKYLGLYSRDVNNYYAVKAKFDKTNKVWTDEVGGVKTKGAYFNPWLSNDDLSDRLKKNPTGTIISEAVENLLTTGRSIADTIMSETDMTKFAFVRSVKNGAAMVTNFDPPPHASKLELVLKAGFEQRDDGYYIHPDITGHGFPSPHTLSEAYRIAEDALSSHDIQYLGKSIRWFVGSSRLGNLVNVKSGHSVPDTDGAIPMMEMPDRIPDNLDKSWYIERAERVLKEIAYYD